MLLTAIAMAILDSMRKKQINIHTIVHAKWGVCKTRMRTADLRTRKRGRGL